MIVVFRAHRSARGLGEDYSAALKRMEELGTRTPGYVSHKAYVTEDGERLTLIEWESAEALPAVSL
jgi:heme-degrading monooxygenase HmoA